MNKADKLTHNFLKYGTTNPTLLQRLGLQGKSHYERWVNPINGEATHFNKAFIHKSPIQQELVNSGYANNLVIYSIINRIARTAAQSEFYPCKVKDQASYRKYIALQSKEYSPENSFEINRLRVKALERIRHDEFDRICTNPNEQMSGSDHIEAMVINKLITGNAYEYANKKNGKKIGELWVLPSQFVKIITNNSFPVRVNGYQLSFGSGLIPLKEEDVMHVKYYNPKTFDALGSHLYGFSPLEAAWLTILGDNTARQALVEQLQNRGVRGIFTVESDKIQTETSWLSAKDQLHLDWQNNSKNYKDKIMPIFGRGQWHNIGLTAKDLAALEICGASLKDLCNVYNVSDLLFNNQEASTRDNIKIARKDFITNAVLPVLTSIRDGRNRMIKQGKWGGLGENVVFDFDATIFTELEADKKETAEWMKLAGCFTDNEIRVQLNFEEHNYPYANEPWKTSKDIPVSLIETHINNPKAQQNETI